MDAATTILRAMRDLRGGTITDEQFRTAMQAIRKQLGESAYTLAKLQAVANDR